MGSSWLGIVSDSHTPTCCNYSLVVLQFVPMSHEFDRFTDDDRRALAEEFGLEISLFGFTSDHADFYLKDQSPHVLKNYEPDDRDWIRAKDVSNFVSNRDIYIERFLEDCFRLPLSRNTIRGGRRVLNFFYKWKREKEEDFFDLHTDAALLAAHTIEEITIHDVYEYTNNKAEIFSGKAFYKSTNPDDRELNIEKAREWNNYRRILNKAALIDMKMPR